MSRNILKNKKQVVKPVGMAIGQILRPPRAVAMTLLCCNAMQIIKRTYIILQESAKENRPRKVCFPERNIKNQFIVYLSGKMNGKPR